MTPSLSLRTSFAFFAISNLVDGVIAPRSLAYLLEHSTLPSTLEYEQIL